MAVLQRKNLKGEIRYLVRVRDRFGRWFPAETFDRMVDAKRRERDLLQDRDRGVRRNVDLTFAEYIELWTSQCRHSISKGWIISQDQMLRDYVRPRLDGFKLAEIRPQDIGTALQGVIEAGRAPSTAKHVYAMLHKLFEDAVEHFELLDRNPVLRRYRPKVPIRERAFLAPADSWKLMEYVAEHYQGPAVWLQLLAGLRPSEVQALRWNAVDFERGQILIRAAYNRKEKRLQEHPKQQDWGMAPMPQQLAAYLAARRGEPEAFVVRNRAGGMLAYETYEDQLPRFCKRAGVTRVTPHELRHSCTELYVQAGASAEDVRRLLNQKSLTATARYMHRTDERLKSIAGRIGEPLETRPTPPAEPQLRLVK
jgi:integrase